MFSRFSPQLGFAACSAILVAPNLANSSGNDQLKAQLKARFQARCQALALALLTAASDQINSLRMKSRLPL